MAVDTAELKQRIDLQGVIEGYTTLSGGPKEFYGPCPKCGGTDRFHFLAGKGWFCRKCTGDPSVAGWHDAIDLVMLVHGVNFMTAYEMLSAGGLPELTAEELAEREARQRQSLAELEAEREKRRKELDDSRAWEVYHQNLDKLGGRYLWHERGLTDEWIDYYKVGFCESRQFHYGKGEVYTGASLTIPTFHTELTADGTPVYRCVSLVHRVFGDNPPCGKYRPHTSGLGKVLFRADLSGPEINGPVLLVEGEIKAMVAYSHIQDDVLKWQNQGYGSPLLGSLNVVGHAGAGFKREAAEELSGASKIWVCFDPDATREAEAAAAVLGVERCKIVELPGKIDDMILEGSLTTADLYEILTNARSI